MTGEGVGMGSSSSRRSKLLDLIGNPPATWCPVRLGGIGHFIKGKGIVKEDLLPVGIPCLRYADIYTKYHNVADTLESFVPSGLGTPLQNSDLVFASSGETPDEIGKAVAWLGSSPAVVGGDTIILRDHGQDATFLAHAANAEYVVRQKSRLGKGHSVVHIHSSDLAELLFLLPPVDEQRKIAKMLRTWDDAIAKLAATLSAVQRQKRSLVNQIMANRLHFPAEDRE